VRNLYSHLSKVMDHIIDHCPHEALNKLEEISFLIKYEDELAIEEFLKLNQVNMYATPGEPCIAKATSNYIERAQKIFNVSFSWVLNLFYF
jgi:hypothetical protein